MPEDIDVYSPYITVIICAHNRRIYLMEAINSVLNQTIDKSKFEIILVKNFKDTAIDDFIARIENAKSIYTEVQNLSNKQAVGIREAKGSIICFLDDDDLYDAERLSVIFQYFQQIADLSFIHNGMLFIDPKGDELQKSPDFKHIYYSPGSSKSFEIKRMLTQMVAYNPSSIAISRELAYAYLDLLDKTFREVDTFWFACALDYGQKIVAIPDHLTKYRRHSEGLSRASDSKKVFEYSRVAIDNMSIIKSNLKSNNSQQYTLYKLNEWILKMAIFNPEQNGVIFKIKLVINILKFSSWIPTKDFIKLVGLACLSMLSQNFALALYPTLYA